MTRIRTRPTLLSLLLCVSFAAHADNYGTARTKLVEAYRAGDFSAMQVAALESLDARPDYPGALFNLALAHTLAGDRNAAITALQRLTALEVDLDIDKNPAFVPLQEHDDWQALVSAVAVLRQPVGSATIAWQFDDGEFVPEGIAVDGDDVYLGSIRSGAVVRVSGNEVTYLRPKGSSPGGSIFGMRRHEDRLWYLAVKTDQYQVEMQRENATDGSALCQLKIVGGGGGSCTVLLNNADDLWTTLGDLIFVNGIIYTSDQTDGPVYSIDLGGNGFNTVVEKGEFVSPQGLVADDSGDYLYVADYRGGIFRVRLDGYAAPERLDSAASLYGIDGLYRYGDWLIAVQNGITPHRVSAHRLADDGLRVIESRILLMNHPDFDEPNLGEVVGDDFYVIANSHWNRFDADNNLPEGLSGPIVLKIELELD
ncbi:MAG: hypothetical protein AAGI27_00775 [Pseudomonadota bacterium]